MLTPGHGWMELAAGARRAASLEAFARAELGWKLTPNAEAFAFGEALISAGGPAGMAGVGARLRW